MQKRLENKFLLAAHKHPRNLDEYIDDEHIIGIGKLMRRAIEDEKLFSPIFL